MSQNRNLPATQQRTGQGLQRREPVQLTRLGTNQQTRELVTFDPQEAVSWIDEASTIGHIVTPSMTPIFPHGHGVAVSVVRITDFDSQGTQLYPIKGAKNLGLHKNVLDEIGRGYGIDWPREWTKREPFTLPGALTEDPRDKDPHCIKVTVCGRFKRFDGNWFTLPALTKEIDLRDGSDEVKEIYQTQYDKEVGALPPNATSEAKARAEAIARRKAEKEVAQLRKFIRAHAQTKARLQVIGTLVRRSYTREELEKPFFIFSSVWTGRSLNPDIDMMLAQGTLKMEMESRALLYGGTPAADPKALPSVSEQPYQEDAEMLAYEQALKENTPPPCNIHVDGFGWSPASEPLTTTTAASPDGPRQCTPDECFGKGSIHVKACYQEVVPAGAATSPTPTAAAAPAPRAETAWIITDGPMVGIAVSDPKVSNDALSSLVDFYSDAINQGEGLSEDSIGRLQRKLNHVVAELERRGAFGAAK
jgi:hypothetical protein